MQSDRTRELQDVCVSNTCRIITGTTAWKRSSDRLRGVTRFCVYLKLDFLESWQVHNNGEDSSFDKRLIRFAQLYESVEVIQAD